MARVLTRPRAAALVAAVAVALALGARTSWAQPLPPALTQPVNDFAHVIDADNARAADALIRALQQASGDVVVVATVDTFAPYATIDEYAVKMFENGGRGIGQKGKDNGLLIVVAINDRRVKVEVGYDLEQFVTDGFAGEVSRDEMAPRFRDGNYGAGVLAGVQRIVGRIAEGRNVSLEGVPVPQRRRSSSSGFPFFGLFILFIVIRALVGLARRGSRRRGPPYWGGGGWSGWSSGVGPFIGTRGGFGGGGFGGGGGGFGGFGGFGGGRSGGGGGGAGW